MKTARCFRSDLFSIPPYPNWLVERLQNFYFVFQPSTNMSIQISIHGHKKVRIPIWEVRDMLSIFVANLTFFQYVLPLFLLIEFISSGSDSGRFPAWSILPTVPVETVCDSGHEKTPEFRVWRLLPGRHRPGSHRVPQG